MPRSRKGLEDLMGSEERHIEEMELNILIGVRYSQRMGTGNFDAQDGTMLGNRKLWGVTRGIDAREKGEAGLTRVDAVRH